MDADAGCPTCDTEGPTVVASVPTMLVTVEDGEVYVTVSLLVTVADGVTVSLLVSVTDGEVYVTVSLPSA